MADQDQLDLIAEDGVDVWNAWRAKNAATPVDLSGADLSNKYLRNAMLAGADLSKANLNGADCRGADLRGANLDGAHLNSTVLSSAKLDGAKMKAANVQNAHLENTSLIDADLESANLSNSKAANANFTRTSLRKAVVAGARFDSAIFTVETRGTGRLSLEQRASIKLVEEETISEVDSEGPKSETADKIAPRTVGYAKNVVGPASWILDGLTPPNDMSGEDLDLFENVRKVVKELDKSLSTLAEDNALLSKENEELRDKIAQALPLWKKAWQVFVMSVAGSAGVTLGSAVGTGAAFAAGYTTGFVSGILHDAFSPGTSCLA